MPCAQREPTSQAVETRCPSRGLKRCADILLALLIGVISLPLFLVCAAAVRLGSKGPVFYRAPRLGCDLRPFCIWKFRTMVEEGDTVLEQHLAEHPGRRLEWESRFKLRHDPRVTRVGRFLRMTSLDELPQLWNVLRGEMSLVGPRPIIEAEKPLYGDALWVFSRTPPGITGLWQVSGRSHTDYAERVRLDVWYVRHWRLSLDLWILVKTVHTVLFCRGAY
mgnify:CR=1 FL=1